MSYEQDVQLLVADTNDHPPVFDTSSGYEAAVSENALLGTSVAFMTASDEDVGWNGRVTYRVLSPQFSHFRIDSVTGVL